MQSEIPRVAEGVRNVHGSLSKVCDAPPSVWNVCSTA